MDAHEADDELCQTLDVDRVVLRIRFEERTCLQVDTPKAGHRAILEYETSPLCTQSAVLARGTVPGVEKTQIHRRGVPGE